MPIYNHENYIPVEENSIIWRYMDFDKFESLLKTSSLFFCRADKFSDPFEGSIPKKEADFRDRNEKSFLADFGFENDKSQALLNIQGMKSLHQRFKRATLINCWHHNNNESDAMWRLYLKDNEGVAIQSNVKMISQVIENNPAKIALTKVRYIDYESDIWYHKTEYPHTNYNLNTPFIHKRKEFKHENEVRLIYSIEDAVDDENYWNIEENNKGKLLKIDLNLLIEKIYLPPTIDEGATSKILELTKKCGFNFELVKSKLSSEPFF